MIGKLLSSRKSPMLTSMVYVQALVLVRSALMARVLGPEQFGLAMIFVLIQQFLDMSTDVGINKYILSARGGHQVRTQRVLHAISLARGFALSLILVTIGYPVLHQLDDRLDLTPFVILAGATIIMGSIHSDNIREQRVEIYRSQSVSAALGETAALLFTLASLQFRTDYIVALYAILVRAAVTVATSHLLARRPYRLEYERESARPIWKFALPLIVNGPLLFFAGQADRLLVSASLGPKELGIYSATLLLVMSPAALYARFLGAIYLPKIARDQRRGATRDAKIFRNVMLGSALLIAGGFALFGPFAVHLIFGSAFVSAASITTLVGVVQALRFLQVGPSTLLLAQGRTRNVLICNMVRLLTLPSTWLGFVLGNGLIGLLTGLLAGELIALLWAIRSASRSRATGGTTAANGAEIHFSKD